MKKYGTLKIIRECLLVLLVLIILIHISSGILMRKNSRHKFQEFYEQEQDFDVLFFGSSHVNSGIVPMDLWEQNGIVGYNMSTSGSRMGTLYWVLRNSLEYTTPRLVVIDAAYLRDEKANNNVSYNHLAFDSMPMSKLKVDAILDLYDDKKDIIQYLLPFTLYHNRWEDLTVKDFQQEEFCGLMGVSVGTGVTPTKLTQLVAEETSVVDNISTDYLDMIVDLCRSKDIEILLVYLPFWPNDDSRNDAAYLHVLAEQYGVRYLDPNQLAQYIDPSTDFLDSMENNSHLNISGGHKISYFLGDYIAEHYDIEDRRADADYAAWHTYYQMYREKILSSLDDQEEIGSYLTLLADRNFSCVIRVNNPQVWQDELTVNQLKNLGAVAADESDNGYLTVNWDETSSLAVQEEGGVCIYSKDVQTCCWDASDTDADIRILVLERESMKMIHSAAFSLETHQIIR